MKRIFAAVVAVGAGVALLGGGVAAVQAARKTMTKDERAQARLQRQARLGKKTVKAAHGAQKSRGPDTVVGTITYDPGAPQDSFISGGGNDIVANRFNSALGGPLRPGNVTGVTFFPGIVNSFAVVSVLGPPVGTTAPILAIYYVNGAVPNTFNTVTLPSPVAVGADFMAGQYVGSFDGPDQAGLRAASVAGQGFHAHQMNFVVTIATGIVPLPGQNGMFRASGNILTPVELMDFKIQ